MANLAIPAPRKAEKKRVKLKMAVQGPSGSGKTWGALALAKNLWPEAKVCVIDTENESASLYADSYEFDTIPLAPPFGTDRYVACIDAVVKGGYDVLIIDSITAQWDGEGGILRRKEALERANPNANGYSLWARFTPEHEAFKQVILQSPIHVICTMRSKQEYALQANDKGKMVPVKLGLAPIQRDQLDYEFTLVFDLNLSHSATVSKDRTGLFNEQGVDLADPKTATAIRGWLDKGIETIAPAPVPVVVAEPVSHAAPKTETQQSQPKFSLVGDILTCVIVGKPTEKMSKKNTPYLTVNFNSRVDGFNYAYCYHESLFAGINDGVGKEVVLKIKPVLNPVPAGAKPSVKYFTIEDVVSVDGQPVKKENLDAEPVEEAVPA